ncbi:alpha/beta hydrolase family protein [Bacillus cereus]|uniref:alpha/beta hydrolase family protein n=1 Tax=Bacillus cereus TaxID=1396 RepID=UPI001238C3E5|nr:hypothetical protein [Bacillus cereus]KAA6470412.1 hypothetical protein DX931_28665 [Bacillus cereus]
MQLWFQNNKNHKLCGFISGNLNSNIGVIFLPGLGQTKAGPYFLFTQISRAISNKAISFQFDYTGTGDSEGDITDLSFNSLLDDSISAINYLKKNSEIKQLVLVGSGMGNYLVPLISNVFPETKAILLAPNYELVEINEFDLNNSATYIDTSKIGCWEDSNNTIHDFFQRMGSGLNRNKGIVLKRSFFEELLNFNLKKTLNTNIRNILKFSVLNEKNSIEIENGRTITLKNSSYKSFHPLDSEIVINKISDWISGIDLEGDIC